MAPINNNKLLHCCVLSYLLAIVLSVHVMQQDTSWHDIDGTYRMSSRDGRKIFFSIEQTGDILQFSTPASMDGVKTPFPTLSVRSTDGGTVLKVDKTSFLASVHSYKIECDGCELKFQDGTVLEKVETIRKVNLIYMNHLDVGYNTNHYYAGSDKLIPGYIVDVLNWYFEIYFPRAVKLGDELRALRANETFIYTTHPWLLSLYLDCPDITLSGVKLQCPTETDLNLFRRAVWLGDIAWHAGPFNTEPESTNGDLFSYGLTLSKELDDYFDLKKTARTASNRDVPGWTKAAIPYLVKNGIVALSIGVNPSSAPPDVPSPNVWSFQNTSIITYWHKGGYPNAPGPSPQKPGGLNRDDCQFVNGLDEVLCFAFRQDNQGPPESVNEIRNYYKILRYQFPGAFIKASTFEDFTQLLVPLKHTFPVVTDEIGDTWIQGPASDPVKMAKYRTINRLRSECLKRGRCNLNDKRVRDMSRLLLKLPEHTYGLASNYDWKNWTNDAFQPLQYKADGFVNDTKSWLSHRAFNDLSIQALKDHPLATVIKQELGKLQPYVPDWSDYEYHDSSKTITCRNGMQLKVGKDGGLIQMTDISGREWADANNALATIMYRTYNTTDFDQFSNQYSYFNEVGIWKPGLDKYTTAESKFWPSPMRSVMVSKGDDPCGEIFVRIITLDAEAWWKYGAPSEYLLKYSVQDNATVDIEYQFFNKPSSRMPESLLLNFQPKPKTSNKWYVHKVGYLIDPTRVVNNGSQYVHAVDRGVAYLDKDNNGLFIESLDIATVLVQTKSRRPSPFPIPLQPVDEEVTGMAFNIYNNIWETNFICWYPYQPQDKHFKARFKLRFT